eukprot:11671574-Karenia_brevis.AAC.1
MTVQLAKQKWQAYEQQERKKTKIKFWLLEQPLPCRCCTDRNGGQELWKPVSAFHVSRDELPQKVLARGQDLA